LAADSRLMKAVAQFFQHGWAQVKSGSLKHSDGHLETTIT